MSRFDADVGVLWIEVALKSWLFEFRRCSRFYHLPYKTISINNFKHSQNYA